MTTSLVSTTTFGVLPAQSDAADCNAGADCDDNKFMSARPILASLVRPAQPDHIGSLVSVAHVPSYAVGRSELWALDIPAADKVVRTVVVYAGLAVLVRLAGKRNLAQLNSFDLVVVLLLSNVVQNALIGPDDSVTGALLGAVVLLAANAVVVRIIHRSDRAVRVFEGSPVALVKDGRFVDRSLHRQGLRRADVETALRAQGADGAADVAEATLSPGGSIVVWLKPEEMSANRGDIAAIQSRLEAIERALVVGTQEGRQAWRASSQG